MNKNKDGLNYCYSDSGCEEATKFLGYQSNCLRCPFVKCVYDWKGWHKKQREQMVLQGEPL